MKKTLILLSTVIVLVTFFGLSKSLAQCPGCQIDANCGVGINPVEPTLCPPTLPNGVQGQPYDQDLTFFMPKEFTDEGSGADVTLNSITVTQITGIPQGLAYQCNNAGCTYTVTTDPLTQRGCVKICGTPNVPGNYNIVVAVVANVNTPLGIINQPTGFTIPLTIEPSPGGNCCFSYNPPSACGELDVTYQALLDFSPLQPTTYDWDFGNGNTSTDQNPPVQNYDTPGEYYTSLTTTVYNYVVTDVTFTAAGENWCGDVEEIFFITCQGSPDPYFTFTNGNQSSTSSVVDNNLSASWSNLSLILEDNLFTLQFLDSDGTSQDDNLGITSHNITAPGTFNFSTFVNGNQEGFGTVTVGLVVDTIYETTDTVNVYPIPAIPELTFTPSDAVCVGDSILINGPQGPYQYQWFQSTSFESDSSALWVNMTDYYSLRIIDTTYFCQSQSDSVLVQVLPFPNPPVITYNTGNGELVITNNNSGHEVAWYNDGELIANATGNTLGGQTSVGPYTATFTNAGGCSATSLPFSLCLPGTTDPFAVDTVCCGQTLELSASGFTLNPFSTVAWAITPQANGPVTSQEEADAANDAGHVLGISSLGENTTFTRNCSSLEDSLISGTYWVTPFVIENPEVTPLTYDTLVGCRPQAEICPTLEAVDDNWELFPMVFTFPDGSQLNANDAIAFGLPITQALIDFNGGLPCISLTSLFAGDPNGVWDITITNTGTTALEMNVPDFIVINYADTCELIDEDETYLIEGISLVAGPGETVSWTFDIPPLPSGFPLVNENCAAFGTPRLINFADCYPDLTSDLAVSGTVSNSTSSQSPNGYIDVSVTGGTPPYSFAWGDGPTSEDRFNLAPGTYTVTVTDNVNATATGTWVVDGPPLGVDDALSLHGFSIGNAVPNPFSHSTTISFESRKAGSYLFEVRDLTGRRVASMDVKAGAGENRILFDGSELSSGVYVYSLSNGTSTLSNRMAVGH